MATWSETNGGKFGKAEWMWLDWVLRGNAKSGEFFTGNGAKADGWSVEKANLERIKVFPPYSGSGPPAAEPKGAPPAQPAAPKGVPPAEPAVEPAAEPADSAGEA
jgi:hypothetical protein